MGPRPGLVGGVVIGGGVVPRLDEYPRPPDEYIRTNRYDERVCPPMRGDLRSDPYLRTSRLCLEERGSLGAAGGNTNSNGSISGTTGSNLRGGASTSEESVAMVAGRGRLDDMLVAACGSPSGSVSASVGGVVVGSAGSASSTVATSGASVVSGGGTCGMPRDYVRSRHDENGGSASNIPIDDYESRRTASRLDDRLSATGRVDDYGRVPAANRLDERLRGQTEVGRPATPPQPPPTVSSGRNNDVIENPMCDVSRREKTETVARRTLPEVQPRPDSRQSLIGHHASTW